VGDLATVTYANGDVRAAVLVLSFVLIEFAILTLVQGGIALRMARARHPYTAAKEYGGFVHLEMNSRRARGRYGCKRL
jgi:hypothetical protein